MREKRECLDPTSVEVFCFFKKAIYNLTTIAYIGEIQLSALKLAGESFAVYLRSLHTYQNKIYTELIFSPLFLCGT